MCTLTIYNSKKRCVVTMNRDERRTRRESGLLYSRSCGDVRLFHPVDVLSGGTWFGINNRGVVLCLLNRYQAQDVADPVSRGTIIPRALEQGGAADVQAWLEKLPYGKYNPFDLFLVTRKKALQYSWDGQQFGVKALEFEHWYMFTSSGMLTEEVIAFRQNFFKAWSGEMGKTLTDANEILRGFHLIQIEDMETHSVLMEREASHTKSVIQADLNGKSMILTYIPEVLEKSLVSPLAEAQVEKIEKLDKKVSPGANKN